MRRIIYPLAICATVAIASACMPSYQYEMNKFAYTLNIIKQLSYRWTSFEGLVTEIEKESLKKVDAAKGIKDEQKRAQMIKRVNRSVADDPVLRALVSYDESWLACLEKHAGAGRSAAKGGPAAKEKAAKKLEESIALIQASEKLMKESKPADKEEGLAVISEAAKKIAAARAIIDSI